ncbi:aminotransferase class I/II-fold pyridoxal phosphate-dependent enzyme [Sessilibacter sp. MAH4]
MTSKTNRDITVGSKACNFLLNRYNKYKERGYADVVSRIFHGIPSKHAQVSYNNIEFCDNPTDSSHIEIQNVLHLGSYNYSGLNGHPDIIAAAKTALENFGTTTSGVRLLNGTSRLHIELEKKLAEFLRYDTVITYSSGFAANLAVFDTLCDANDVIFSDSLNHESIVKGIELSGARCEVFPHKDMAALAALLEKESPEIRKFIVTDGVFSMDGDLAPLPELCDLSEKYGCFLIVDDAHGTAAIGPNGRGTVAHFGLEDKVDIITGSLSKGLPGIGGFVACNDKTGIVLRTGSAPYIFSASIPPATAAGILKAVEILETSPEIAESLQYNAKFLRDSLRAADIDILDSETAVIPIVVRADEKAFMLAKRLHEKGVYANPVVFPAVKKGRARVRLNVSADLTQQELDFAVKTLIEETKAVLESTNALAPAEMA